MASSFQHRPDYDKEEAALRANDHLWLAQEIEFARDCLMDTDVSIPWTLVTIFYAALNLVDAILRGKGYTYKRHVPKDDYDEHEARNSLIPQVFNARFVENYDLLYQYSLRARYRPAEAMTLSSHDLGEAVNAFVGVIEATGYKLPTIMKHLPVSNSEREFRSSLSI